MCARAVCACVCARALVECCVSRNTTRSPRLLHVFHTSVCVCVCVRARACVRALVCVCVCVGARAHVCAEGAVTKRQWPGWSCRQENASREGCVSKRALCVVCVARLVRLGIRLPLQRWPQPKAVRGIPCRSAWRCSWGSGNAHAIVPPGPAWALMRPSRALACANQTRCDSNNTCRMNCVCVCVCVCPFSGGAPLYPGSGCLGSLALFVCRPLAESCC